MLSEWKWKSAYLYFVGLVISSIAVSMINHDVSSGLLVFGIGIGIAGFCCWCANS